MKPIIPALLGALLTAGAVNAAQTTPVGYSTVPLLQGYNVVGLTLHPSAMATGDFELTAGFGSTVTDTDTTFAPVAGRLYVLEINDGGAAGTIVEVPAASISGNTITTTTDLELAGVVDGTKYSLRVAPTLEEIFTTVPLASGGVLTAALSAGSADVVWVPNGTGGYDQYYLRSGTTPEFRKVSTNLASPNVPLVYADGILIQKKNTTAASLTVTGEVKKVGTNGVLIQGYNVLSVVAPAGLNLFNAGLEDDLAAALSAGSADIVWVQQPDLSYKQYFRRSGTGAGWRDVANATVTMTQAEAEAVTLSGAILIQKKGAASSAIDIAVPSFYDTL